jgi:hypothetical protein
MAGGRRMVGETVKSCKKSVTVGDNVAQTITPYAGGSTLYTRTIIRRQAPTYPHVPEQRSLAPQSYAVALLFLSP